MSESQVQAAELEARIRFELHDQASRAGLTEVQLATLQLIDTYQGITPSTIGWKLIEAGLVTIKRRSTSAQGAALIASKPVYTLRKRGLVDLNYRYGAGIRGYRSTMKGEALLKSSREL